MIQSAAVKKAKTQSASRKLAKQCYPSRISDVVDEPTEEADDAAPTRDELKEKAAELGIVFAKNIRNDRLLELIEAELALEPEA
jgi:hypothetical protein